MKLSKISTLCIATLTLFMLSVGISHELKAQQGENGINQAQVAPLTVASFTIPLFSFDAGVSIISSDQKLGSFQAIQVEEERKRKRLWWIVGGAATVVVTSAILMSSSSGSGSGDYIPEPPGRP